MIWYGDLLFSLSSASDTAGPGLGYGEGDQRRHHGRPPSVKNVHGTMYVFRDRGPEAGRWYLSPCTGSGDVGSSALRVLLQLSSGFHSTTGGKLTPTTNDVLTVPLIHTGPGDTRCLSPSLGLS